MKTVRITLALAATIMLTAFVTAQVTSSDAGADDGPPWLQHCEPCPQHERLQALVGEWDQTLRFWREPGAEPETSETRASYRWIYGGRYLVAEINGYVAGDRLDVRRIMGYDSYREEYFSFLIDSESTSYMLARGTFDANRGLVLKGTTDDIVNNRRNVPYEVVHRIVNENEVIAEMHVRAADGSMFRTLEVVSKRR